MSSQQVMSPLQAMSYQQAISGLLILFLIIFAFVELILTSETLLVDWVLYSVYELIRLDINND